MVFSIRLTTIAASLLLLISGTMYSQNPVILRSTLGSATIYSNPAGGYAIAGIPQSTGQAGASGSFMVDRLLVIQGFLHPVALTVRSTELTVYRASVYPNPFISSFTVYIPEEDRGESSLKLHNLYGMLVYRDDNYLGNPLTINIDHLPAGIYFLTITGGGKVFYSKLIKEI